MEWTRLLSTKRQRQNRYKSQKYGDADLRSEFEKDYHRIIGSASFRRLQDKTQVFPLDKSDFIRTRLTHSMEVSSLAKSLGQNIGESILVHKKDSSFTVQMKEDICNILQCAGLIHDIGNPPFGHYGEFAIREWFERNLPDNEEYAEAVRQKLPMLTRAELLGQLMTNYDMPIAISGTHGKTTTTSMLSHILLAAVHYTLLLSCLFLYIQGLHSDPLQPVSRLSLLRPNTAYHSPFL